MRIYSLLSIILLTIGLVGTPAVFADSHGNFPGKGSLEAYAKSIVPGNKAMECSKKGDYQTAVRLDRESISIYPYDSASYHNLGDDLEKLGKFDEAQKAQEQAIALEPTYTGAWIAIGLIYEHEHKLSDAERYYRKAVQIEPRSWEAVADLGDILRQQGKFGEARDWLIKAKACAVNERCRTEVDRKLMQCDKKESSN